MIAGLGHVGEHEGLVLAALPLLGSERKGKQFVEEAVMGTR